MSTWENPLIFKETNKGVLKSGNLSVFNYKHKEMSIATDLSIHRRTDIDI